MVQTVGKVRHGKDAIVVFDHGAACLWTDLVTEIEEADGIVRMTFAAVHKNGDGIHKATVAVRLRMTEDVAFSLCRELRRLQEV